MFNRENCLKSFVIAIFILFLISPIFAMDFDFDSLFNEIGTSPEEVTPPIAESPDLSADINNNLYWALTSNDFGSKVIFLNNALYYAGASNLTEKNKIDIYNSIVRIHKSAAALSRKTLTRQQIQSMINFLKSYKNQSNVYYSGGQIDKMLDSWNKALKLFSGRGTRNLAGSGATRTDLYSSKTTSTAGKMQQKRSMQRAGQSRVSRRR